MDDPRRPSEPGWYQDPFGTTPEDRRYWDGETWLPSQPAAPFMESGQPYQPPQYAQPVQQPQQFGQQPQQVPPAQPGWAHPEGGQWQGMPAGPATPDGVRIAGWARRFGAYVLDTLLIAIVTLAFGFVLGIWDALNAVVDAAVSPATSEDEINALVNDFVVAQAGPILWLSLGSLVASAAYHIGMVATSGRTLGKRALGIRVRRYDSEGLPGWGAAALRWLVQFGLPNLLSNLQLVSFFAAFFPILDGLWPLWDVRRQAIHDKAARTVVVHR